MKKDINEYKVKLTGEYLNQFKKIEQFIECSDGFDNRKYECLEEILDLLLTAQEDGKASEEVVGNDIKTFCNNILLGVSNHSIVYHLSVRLMLIAFTALAIGVFIKLLNNIWKDPGFHVVGNQINIISTYGIASATCIFDFLIDCYFRKRIVKKGVNKYIKHRSKIRLILVLVSSVLFGFVEEFTFGKVYTTLPRMLLIAIITLFAAGVIEFIEKRGSFDNSDASTFNKFKKKELLITALHRKYEKKKDKNIRKNRVYSLEHFENEQKKEINIGHVMQCVILPFILWEDGLFVYSILIKGSTVSKIIMFIFVLVLTGINIKFIVMKKAQLEVLQEFCECDYKGNE